MKVPHRQGKKQETTHLHGLLYIMLCFAITDCFLLFYRGHGKTDLALSGNLIIHRCPDLRLDYPKL